MTWQHDPWPRQMQWRVPFHGEQATQNVAEGEVHSRHRGNVGPGHHVLKADA